MMLLSGLVGLVYLCAGACLAWPAAQPHHVDAVVVLDFDSTELCGNFTDLDGLANTVCTVRPDVIVNAAAHGCDSK